MTKVVQGHAEVFSDLTGESAVLLSKVQRLLNRSVTFVMTHVNGSVQVTSGYRAGCVGVKALQAGVSVDLLHDGQLETVVIDVTMTAHVEAEVLIFELDRDGEYTSYVFVL